MTAYKTLKKIIFKNNHLPTSTALTLLLTSSAALAQDQGAYRLLEKSSLVIRAKVISIDYVTVPGTSQQNTQYNVCGVTPVVGSYSGGSCLTLGSYGSPKLGSFHSSHIPSLEKNEEYIIFIKDNVEYGTPFTGLHAGLYMIKQINSIEYITNFDGYFIDGVDQNGAWKTNKTTPGLKLIDFVALLNNIAADMVLNGRSVPTGLPSGWKWIYD